MSSSTSRSLLVVVVLAMLAVLGPGCTSDFGVVHNPPHLVVTLADGQKTGSLTAPLGLQVGVSVPFKISVTAIASDGSVDTSFDGSYVRISAKPGAIASFTGNGTDGRNLLLTKGQSVTVEVDVTNAYGTTYILADDLGYKPADPLGDPPPRCSNGLDDDNDGAIDFPTDTGCAFANDDSEEGGTYSEGSSTPIYFAVPRVADVRGLLCTSSGCTGNGKTPYPREQVGMAMGYNETTNTYAFDTVVTRLSSTGFFVTDLADKRGGFQSVFAYNFSAPPRMRVCDRMKTYSGTPSEFFGFTQISYPTWTLEEWDPSTRTCLVPTPERLSPTTIADVTQLLPRTANLVRVETTPDKAETTMVTPKFGPDNVPKDATGAYVPSANASNCDFDKNGKINSFTKGDPEGDCSNACTADPQCTEYSNFLSRGTFRLTVTDSNNKSSAIQADSSASAGFDPVANKGIPIRSFSGALTFFSGGAQYTIEARCDDDIVTDLKLGPFLDDFACMTDADCAPDRGLPPNFTCTQLTDPRATKGCRQVTPAAVAGNAPQAVPPPLACVFPRTLLDLNPQ